MTITPPVGAFGAAPAAVSGNNVVGRYLDSSGDHSFLYDGSAYTTLTPPGFNIYATGVSGKNVVGLYFDVNGTTGLSSEVHGFLYNGSSYVTLTPPGAANSDALGVSGDDVVGDDFDGSGIQIGAFKYDISTGVYTTSPCLEPAHPPVLWAFLATTSSGRL